MGLKAPIKVIDETDSDVYTSTAQLCLESGDITNVEPVDWDKADVGVPAAHKDYAFTCGVLALNGKEVEFAIEASKDGDLSISADELEELKKKATALFSQGSSPTVKPKNKK